MLDAQDFHQLAELLDQKLDEKLDQKFDEKLKPIYQILNQHTEVLNQHTKFFEH